MTGPPPPPWQSLSYRQSAQPSLVQNCPGLQVTVLEQVLPLHRSAVHGLPSSQSAPLRQPTHPRRASQNWPIGHSVSCGSCEQPFGPHTSLVQAI